MSELSQNHAPRPHDLETSLRILLSGGIAGCFAKTAIGPLDRVKILFQTSNPHYKHHSGTFSGVFKVARDIYCTQGLKGLFRGHSVMIIRIFPYSATNYLAYEQFKKLLYNTERPSVFRRILAGSMAGACAVSITYPLDTLRARMASQVKAHEILPLHSLIRKMATENRYPWSSFYKGFLPSLYGILPYAGVSFFTYETFKNLLKGPGNDFPVHKRLFCGMIAGSVAQTASYPLDVVRRRLQMQGITSHLPNYIGTFHAIRTIIQTEGIRGLYVGWSSNGHIFRCVRISEKIFTSKH
ncbi:mitochondrial carrier [Rozella allomycis CSF55]|uniref:Mitochondrial carrier n=1 Tax=Rozella allomycis (strain CSF55) TaxID=988480 RepID=A0A4P9YF54_ROZAC|nr:mitochondrial carrier [Rozella allomycis CSF55]